MGEFIDMREGERLLDILATGVTADRKRPLPQDDANPLYHFQGDSTGNRYLLHPAIEESFILLKRNGYGDTFVGKTDEAFKNDARRNLGSGDPSWLADVGKAELDKLVYFMNFQQAKGLTTIHYLPERLCDGTVHAVLSRAMALGDNVKPAWRPQARPAAPGPA